jgi:23S rRNA-/tRNA-specific pseudouridylate synthase
VAYLLHLVCERPFTSRGARRLVPRQFLHAAHLEFAHPITGEWLTFDAPLPRDLARFKAE